MKICSTCGLEYLPGNGCPHCAKVQVKRPSGECSGGSPCSAPLRPPHADPSHQHHTYYRPETDDYPPEEAEIEEKWRQSKGVDADGKAWLTPRMERNAIALAERMSSWPNTQALAQPERNQTHTP